MKIYCPYCRVALDYHGSNLAICRCASCGERFIFHDNYEYVMPDEEETTTSIFEENPKSQTLIAQEQEDRIRADYEKFVVRMGSAASSTANWSAARKAEAIRDMKITGNYFEIDWWMAVNHPVEHEWHESDAWINPDGEIDQKAKFKTLEETD